MIPLLSLIIILAFSILVTRIASIALSHTGLSRESAKFQARSAFTGVGFTTNESEKVVKHPVRRRIILTLMLIGNAGIISAIASLMLTFVNSSGENNISWGYKVMVLAGSITLLWLLSKSKLVDRWLALMIDRALKKYTDLDVRDYMGLLHLYGEYEISSLKVEPDDWICNKQLGDIHLRDEGINVLGITRKNGKYIGIPKGDTKIEAGDDLLLYGRGADIKELDKRKQGWTGEKKHKEAVEEQKEILEKQKDVKK